MARFDGEPCVFCDNPSVGVGEHVWPAWFIAEFHGQGPFTSARGGETYVTRHGTPQKSSALPGVHVPMCAACNTALNTHLEAPAKPIVRKLLEHGDSSDELLVSKADSAALAGWLLKVGLLSDHPKRRHDLPAMDRDEDVPMLRAVRPEWFSWMTAGQSPPDGFSVYLTRRELTDDPPLDKSDQEWIVLPRVTVDGRDVAFISVSFGFTGVNVTIVWHPGWPIDHPQVGASRAVRIWPEPHEFNFGALPGINPREFRFMDGTILEIGMTTAQFAKRTRTPLSVDTDPIASFLGIDDGVDHAAPGD
ncbi:hypothetical protein NYQ31_15205 [Curtobacterium flaccumfaciens]|uniref:hypothetical protein n=1 Tax=Curtobacterium flaccumfaciens TaxID=2035 RepID=UPI00217E5CC4|nr:hypothetical protein [Curtobacterium flaccumfaciens]MCS6559743.1 hypothetical protein [Curtobacterium flaccumfaciens]